jgi:hypothetical protein
MHLELGSECLGITGEPLKVFLELGEFAILLAEKDLVVNQVKQLGGLDGFEPELLNIGFSRHPFSVPPPLAMVLNEGERTKRGCHGSFLVRGG